MMETLLAKVTFLLTISLLLSAFGAFCGRKVQSIAAFLLLSLLFIVGTIVVYVVAMTNPALGIGLLFGWSFIAGLVMGPAIQLRAEELGWETVCAAFLGTAGVMALCGGIGLFSGADFSKLGVYLGLGLFLLIIVGVFRIFIRLSKAGNIVYSLIGMALFTGYFVYDFFRLGRTENTWGNAVGLTVSLFLDFWNFLLLFLELLSEVLKK